MADEANRRVIPGSEPVERVPGGLAQPGAPANPGVIEVSVRLRDRPGLEPIEEILARQAALPVNERVYLSHADMAARGPLPDDVDAVRAFASENGLEFVGLDASVATVTLRGAADAVAAAFGATLRRTSQGVHPVGSLSVPSPLGDIVIAVHGLDTRPVARTTPRHIG